MLRHPFRATGLLLIVALTLGGTLPAIAQPTPVPDAMTSAGGDDGGLVGDSSAVIRRSGSLLRFNFVGGKGVGFDSSYLTVGVFQPFWQSEQSLWYFDAQGLLIGKTFEEKDGLSGGANVGVGYRAPSPWYCNTTWGAYLFYDYSDVYRNAYNQLGVGVESLGETWDLRSNFYFPLDKTSNLVNLSPMTGPIYRQYNMIFQQTETTERAFWGFDAEVGRRLYGNPYGMHLRGYVGTYYYENWDVEGPQFWGVYGRVQAHLLPDLWANVQVNNDEQFKTTASFQLTWLLPACGKRINCISALSDCGPCSGGCGPTTLPGRMMDPVRRNPNIVVRDVQRTIETIATDPTTGLPISILHVDSNAPAGGDGTFENPFNTLAATEAEAAGGGYDIILAHANSVFTGESITLPSDIRFLGEGIDHLVDTEQVGTIVLPPPTGGTVLPIIDGAPGNAVVVASNDEVSGFTITDPGAAGIFADGVAGPVNINRNTIDGGVSGIDIRNSTGTFDVTDTTIRNTSGTAFNVDGGAPIVNSSADITNSQGRIIAVRNTTGGAVTFKDGTLLDDGGDGILVENAAGAVTIDGATLNNSNVNAVDILTSPGAIQLKNIAINSPAGIGVNIFDSNADITNFTINSPGADGILVTSLNANRTVNLTGNTISNAGTEGIDLNVTGTGTLLANVSGNSIFAQQNAFDATTAGAPGQLQLAFDNNTLNSALGTGAFIDGQGGGPLTITSFLNNRVLDAANGGIRVRSATFDASPAVGGIQAVAGGNTVIGSVGDPVQGDGLRLENVAGNVGFTNLEIYNDNGAGLLIDGAGIGPGLFTFGSTTGKIATTAGPAIDARDVQLNAVFDSIASTNSSTFGLRLNSVGGSFKSTTTTITEPRQSGIVLTDSPNFVADFGAARVIGAGVDPTSYANGVELVNNPNAKITFQSLDVTTDYGGGLVANNSGTLNFITPPNISSNGGPVLDLQNTSGQLNGVPGWTFNNLVSTNSTGPGLRLIDLPDPFTVTGTTSIDNAAGPSIEIGGSTAATFNTVAITNRQNVGILLHDTSRDIAFGNTTISGAGGGTAGVQMLDSTAGRVTFSQLAVTDSGGQGIVLDNNAGAFQVTGPTTITRANGTAIEIQDGVGGASFGVVNINQRLGAGILVNGGNQIVSFGATTINNPNGDTGVPLSIRDTLGGRVTLASLTADVNNAASRGVELINNAAVVEVLGGLVSNAADTTVYIERGDADITFNADLANHAGRVVDIVNRAGGIANFGGTITDGGAGLGMAIRAPLAANTVNFNGKVNLGTAANRLTGGTALTYEGGGLPPGTNVVNFANLDVFTDGRGGIAADNGGTLNIATGRIDTLGTGAFGLRFTDIDTHTSLASITVDNIGSTTDAVVLNNITGSFAVSGNTNLGATGAIRRGIVIDRGDASINFGVTNIANRTSNGIEITRTAGTINFGATSISGAGASGLAGVVVRDATAGSVNLASINVSGSTNSGVALRSNTANFRVTGATTITGSNQNGIEVLDNAGNVDFASINVTNNGGRGLRADNVTGTLRVGGGSVTNTNGTAVEISRSLMDITLANITSTNGSAIRLDRDSGAFNVTGTVTQNNGTGDSIFIRDGSANVTLNNLNINNTAGIGVNVEGLTGLFKINNGTVANTGGQAIRIWDTTIDVTLASVAANGGVYGIELVNTPGRFTVNGGLIQNSTFGVYYDRADNVTLNNLRISDAGFYGVFGRESSNSTLNAMTINSSGIAGVRMDNIDTLNMTNMTVNSGAFQNAVWIFDSNTVTISGGTYTAGVDILRADRTNDGSITGVTTNGLGTLTSRGVYLRESDGWSIRQNNLNIAFFGIDVISAGANITTRIEGNTLVGDNTGISINASSGTIALLSGPISDPSVNNTVSLAPIPFSSSGTIFGKIVVNGVLRP